MVYAVIDANNFYASCERIFNPTLEGKPLVILSSNDGCIIARSNEAKKLGIAMGEPVFKWREVIWKNKVEMLSCNFTLYGDMSARLMSILSHFSPDVEIYSVDEAFLDLTGIRQTDLTDYCKHMRQTIKQWTGLPVSIGIATTKTLTKVANHIAKRDERYDGVLDLTDTSLDLDSFLGLTPVGDVWGIGRAHTKKLLAHGVTTALDFVKLDQRWVKKTMGVFGVRTWLELQGQSCIPLDQVEEPNKSIISSRSFGHPISRLEDVEEAVAAFVSRAGEKLREQYLLASYINVYITTGYHPKDDQALYSGSLGKNLPVATDYTPDLITVALDIIKGLYKEGYNYKKAGILLANLTSRDSEQLDFFGEADKRKGRERMMKAVDEINAEWGSETIHMDSVGVARNWKPNSQMRTPRYTTKWEELVGVK